jgi:RNA polymerase sigma-70 factor, ECF subfamily
MAPDEETTVTRRPDTFAAAPALMKSRHWSTDILKSGLEDSLTELVKIRASQINGCALCLCMHSAGARKRGESAEHPYLLDAWRESRLYSELGSVADAQDVVQDAFLRWLDTDRNAVRQPEAFLRRIVTRLCLDHLKSARHQRETDIGPWLPEPVVEAEDDEIDDVTLLLMMALERLSPLERTAFLLHDVFGVSFEEIAETIEREPATCRQLAGRTRTHVRAARPRFDLPKGRGLQIATAFFAASRSGDMQQLRSILAADVTAYADGGGKTRAAMQPIVGVDNVIEPRIACAHLCRAQLAARALWLHQWLARICHDRAGRYSANDGTGDRGWQDCRNLCHAQSGQASTYWRFLALIILDRNLARQRRPLNYPQVNRRIARLRGMLSPRVTERRPRSANQRSIRCL